MIIGAGTRDVYSLQHKVLQFLNQRKITSPWPFVDFQRDEMPTLRGSPPHFEQREKTATTDSR